jgi:hypothetical protein
MKGTDMKRFSPALLLFLNGCFSCGTASHVQTVDPNLTVYRPAVPPLADRHPSSRLDLVAPGTWVRYHLSKDGNETTLTIGAVRVEEKSLWVEVVEEGDPRKVSLRRISFEGEVLSARCQEIPASGPLSEIADQPLIPAPDNLRETPDSVTEEKKSLKVGNRTIDVIVIRKVYRDEPVGREYEEEEAWSKEVPPLLEHQDVGDPAEAAGLVYRKAKTESVMLVDWGTGYTPAIK